MAYAHRIDHDTRVRLADYDPSDHGGLTREEGEARAAKLGEEMAELHDLLFAAGQHAFLVVLQGRDTSGKDGLLRFLLGYLNAQSARVVPFKVPTPEEVAHDFLWRVHKEVPAKGSTAVFNRSHYEDVLVVRVHKLVPEDIWRGRYEHINHFERLLHDADTILLKLYLHISKDEQEQRLLDREKDPTKAWKLAVGDWQERELWDQYTAAYEDALSHCSKQYAPWYVVPANHKWFRNLAAAEQIVEALRPYKEGWMKHLKQVGAEATRELQAYRAQHGR